MKNTFFLFIFFIFFFRKSQLIPTILWVTLVIFKTKSNGLDLIYSWEGLWKDRMVTIIIELFSSSNLSTFWNNYFHFLQTITMKCERERKRFRRSISDLLFEINEFFLRHSWYFRLNVKLPNIFPIWKA